MIKKPKYKSKPARTNSQGSWCLWKISEEGQPLTSGTSGSQASLQLGEVIWFSASSWPITQLLPLPTCSPQAKQFPYEVPLSGFSDLNSETLLSLKRISSKTFYLWERERERVADTGWDSKKRGCHMGTMCMLQKTDNAGFSGGF